MRIEKGNPGYIKNQKKIHIMWLVGIVLVAIAIFAAGYLWTKTRANVFTVMAILMALPGAKRVVALAVILPKKGIEKSRYDKIKEIVGEGILLTDYVFTSTEKIMHLDVLFIKNGNVLAIPASSKQDLVYMKKYLTDSVHKIAPSFHVTVVENEEKLQKKLDKLTKVEATPAREEKLLEYLMSLAV